jgi:hypothetical protein
LGSCSRLSDVSLAGVKLECLVCGLVGGGAGGGTRRIDAQSGLGRPLKLAQLAQLAQFAQFAHRGRLLYFWLPAPEPRAHLQPSPAPWHTRHSYQATGRSTRIRFCLLGRTRCGACENCFSYGHGRQMDAVVRSSLFPIRRRGLRLAAMLSCARKVLSRNTIYLTTPLPCVRDRSDRL